MTGSKFKLCHTMAQDHEFRTPVSHLSSAKTLSLMRAQVEEGIVVHQAAVAVQEESWGGLRGGQTPM